MSFVKLPLTTSHSSIKTIMMYSKYIICLRLSSPSVINNESFNSSYNARKHSHWIKSLVEWISSPSSSLSIHIVIRQYVNAYHVFHQLIENVNMHKLYYILHTIWMWNIFLFNGRQCLRKTQILQCYMN